MRAINHALTGAAIGLIIGEPLIAVPAAVVSHFICDAMPHYDAVTTKYGTMAKQRWLRSPRFRNFLYVDAILCLTLVAVLVVRQPRNWLLAAVCAFAAAAPDLMSLQLYIKRKGRPLSLTAYQKFAIAIQWFERPIGAVVEIAWFIAALIVLAPFLY